MSLILLRYIDLPQPVRSGGFDHAAIHRARARLYVAHTANDALDVIDCARDQYLHSIPNLNGVAGALVSDEHNLVFTSNRGENTVGIFSPDDEAKVDKIAVGIKPNGLSFDPSRNLLLAAHVGDPNIPNSFTVSLVEVVRRVRVADVVVPGRTRWTVYDSHTDAFYVNIAGPAQIVVIRANEPTRVAQAFDIPAAGPHGLDMDAEHQRLFCACDGKKLFTVELPSGKISAMQDLSGVPDVIFFNRALQHLYVAIGDPGVIDVFDTRTMRRIEIVVTEKGAHTLGFDAERNKVYAFLPETHRAAVLADAEQ